jgi:hypothetical protein
MIATIVLSLCALSSATACQVAAHAVPGAFPSSARHIGVKRERGNETAGNKKGAAAIRPQRPWNADRDARVKEAAQRGGAV